MPGIGATGSARAGLFGGRRVNGYPMGRRVAQHDPKIGEEGSDWSEAFVEDVGDIEVAQVENDGVTVTAYRALGTPR